MASARVRDRQRQPRSSLAIPTMPHVGGMSDTRPLAAGRRPRLHRFQPLWILEFVSATIISVKNAEPWSSL